MAVILVPKPPKRAFNKNRPPSSLLRSQMEHLEWATRSKFGDKLARRARSIRTEGEAAAYIEQLTRRLHPEGAAPPPPAAAAPAPQRRRKSKAAPGSTPRKRRLTKRSGTRRRPPRRRTR